MVTFKRTPRGWYFVGRYRYVTVKWLRRKVRRRAGVRQVQFGRLLVRLSPTLAAIERRS